MCGRCIYRTICHHSDGRDEQVGSIGIKYHAYLCYITFELLGAQEVMWRCAVLAGKDPLRMHNKSPTASF